MAYTHGEKWNDEKIKNGILNTMTYFEIDRMPSKTEVDSCTNSFGLSTVISKRGGFKYWADKLGLEMKRSETGLAKKYENFIFELLESKGYNVTKMSMRHPYDLLINDNIKIDVKVAKPYVSKINSIYHTFNLEKRNPTCDIYIAVALNFDSTIDRLFIIPSKYLKLTQLSVGKDSMYNKYVNYWDCLITYDNFYKDVI